MRRLSEQEAEKVFQLATELVGAAHINGGKHQVLISNIESRMDELGIQLLSDYLDYCNANSKEREYLVSSLTIHTTRFFREAWHFDFLKEQATKFALQMVAEKADKFSHNHHNRIDSSHNFNHARSTDVFRFWSAACSTGQELYSAGLVLESVRRQYPNFSYELLGSDIDPVSLAEAKNAVYSAKVLDEIPLQFRKMLLQGSGVSAGLVAIPKEIRQRAFFKTQNLLEEFSHLPQHFHMIFCRNVLIYFSEAQSKNIAEKLLARLADKGVLALGHCEHLSLSSSTVKFLEHSCYQVSLGTKATLPSHNTSASPQGEFVPKQSSLFSEIEFSKSIDCVLVGASTGGVTALVDLLHNLPKPFPPVLVVQHIAKEFLNSFAQDLAKASKLQLWNGSLSRLLPGTLYLALEAKHLVLRKKAGLIYVDHQQGPALHGVVPSVDVLFHSAVGAQVRCYAALLTGMGRDGAAGLLALRKQGNYTLAQDEKSCIVYGMPKEAAALNAACFIGNLPEIRNKIMQCQKPRAA